MNSFYDLSKYEDRHRFYKSKEWRCFRKQVLDREPLCRECFKSGKLEPAIDVDHIIDLKNAPERALTFEGVQPLCKSCHSKKTAGDMGLGKKEEKIINRKWKIS